MSFLVSGFQPCNMYYWWLNCCCSSCFPPRQEMRLFAVGPLVILVTRLSLADMAWHGHKTRCPKTDEKARVCKGSKDGEEDYRRTLQSVTQPTDHPCPSVQVSYLLCLPQPKIHHPLRPSKLNDSSLGFRLPLTGSPSLCNPGSKPENHFRYNKREGYTMHWTSIHLDADEYVRQT